MAEGFRRVFEWCWIQREGGEDAGGIGKTINLGIILGLGLNF